MEKFISQIPFFGEFFGVCIWEKIVLGENFVTFWPKHLVSTQFFVNNFQGSQLMQNLSLDAHNDATSKNWKEKKEKKESS